jgi:PAS domain S-box-containing protein
MAGYSSPQEMIDTVTNIGKDHYVNPHERDEMVRMLLENDTVEGFEVEVYRRDRTTFWISINVHTVRDEEGNILYFEGTNTDITDRKQAELALRESEQRIREIIDNAPFGAHSYRLDDDGRLIFLGGNPAADRILNIDHSPLIGLEIEEAFPILKGRDVAENYRRVALEGGRWVQDVVRYEDKDIAGAFEVFAFQTAPRRMTAFFQDITERKRAEEALRESEELLRTTINATADGIMVVDQGGRISHMNSQFAQIWGFPRELQEAGDDRRLLAHAMDQVEDPAGFRKKVDDLYKSSREDLDEVSFKDGRVFERYSCPIIIEGKEAGRIWDFRDITVRKQAEEARRRSEAKYLRRYDGMLEGFVSVSMDGRSWSATSLPVHASGYDRYEIFRHHLSGPHAGEVACFRGQGGLKGNPAQGIFRQLREGVPEKGRHCLSG